MCKECGCGLPGESPAGISAHHHEHEHGHAHGHDQEHGHAHTHAHSHDETGEYGIRAHEHEHEHEHGPGHHHGEEHEHAHTHAHTHAHDEDHGDPQARRSVELHRAILEKNDRLAERNRGFFRARGLLALNLVSSPGSGKTTFLRETVRRLNQQLKTGIIVGDLATDNDAQRLRETGAPVVQVTTGTVCHLEAEMVARAVKRLPLEGLDLLFIENVGNLVCPASYDLGEELRVVLLSVTEGEDKPLKYPPLFQSAGVVIISKTDLAKACDYDQAAALANLRRVAPRAQVFETSAKTGDGMQAWCAFLREQLQQSKTRDPLAL